MILWKGHTVPTPSIFPLFLKTVEVVQGDATIINVPAIQLELLTTQLVLPVESVVMLLELPDDDKDILELPLLNSLDQEVTPLEIADPELLEV